MPSLATEITEITTGLGALGHDLLAALTDPPPQFVNVGPANWDNLRRAYDQGDHRDLFTTAWLNGRAFLLAADGLRGRIPIRVEWKGPHKQVEQHPIPADLRIDNVFLVSIKTRSAILWNRSPAQVFLRQSRPGHWYVETAPAEYQALYEAVRALGDFAELPDNVAHLTRPQGGRSQPTSRVGNGPISSRRFTERWRIHAPSEAPSYGMPPCPAAPSARTCGLVAPPACSRAVLPPW